MLPLLATDRHHHHKKALRWMIICTVLILPGLTVLQLLTRPSSETSTVSLKRMMSLLDAPLPITAPAALEGQHTTPAVAIEIRSSRFYRNNTIDTERMRLRSRFASSQQKLRLPFCLVHIGKTAGGSVSCRLGGAPRLAKQCPAQDKSTLSSSSSQLEPFCVGKLHKQRDWGCFEQRSSSTNKKKTKKSKKNGLHSNMTIVSASSANVTTNKIHTFLFTLRDPIDRLRSWFYYEHPALQNVREPMGARRDLFLSCNYTTMDELAQLGLQVAMYGNLDRHENVQVGSQSIPPSDDPRISSTCAQRAWKAVTGETGYLYHNRFNYGYYYDWTKRLVSSASTSTSQHPTPSPSLPQLRVLVIRQEHLTEDWNTLEEMYADPSSTTTSTSRRRAIERKQELLLKGVSVESKASRNRHTNDYFDVVKLHQTEDDSNSNKKERSSQRQSNDDMNYNALSPASWPNLCQALCRDILVYRELLEQAENLQHWQRQMSLRELATKCPEQAATPRSQVVYRPDPIFSKR